MAVQTAQAVNARQHSANSHSQSEQQQNTKIPKMTTRLKIVTPIINP